MNTANDLASKAAEAVRKYLAACPLLQGVDVTTETRDEPKKNGSVVVVANRGDVVGGQASGVFSLTVSVAFEMKRERNTTTAKAFLQRCGVIAGLLETNPFRLAELVTAAYGGEFYCYFLQLNGDQKTPNGYVHAISFDLAMEAMSVSRKTGILNAANQG